jgi:hypothetical protein
MVNLRSSGWSTANPPYHFNVDLVLGPIWVLVPNSGRREQPRGTVRGSDHLYAFGWRFIAERVDQVIVDGFDS